MQSIAFRINLLIYFYVFGDYIEAAETQGRQYPRAFSGHFDYWIAVPIYKDGLSQIRWLIDGTAGLQELENIF